MFENDLLKFDVVQVETVEEPTIPRSKENKAEKNHHDKPPSPVKAVTKMVLGVGMIAVDAVMSGSLTAVTGGAFIATGVALGADGANDLKKSFSYESTEEHPPES